MLESNIQKNILLATSKTKTRLFRNNVGQAWTGNEIIRNRDGSVLIKDARPLKAGVKGMADLIGLTPVTITPDMVGKTLAVYTAIEVKTTKGRASKEQVQFLEFVASLGGFAGVARSPEDALRIIQNQRESEE